MKIAIMGIRGIPANYGGFETFAENLSVRLVEKGHEVTVYGRSNAISTKERVYKGVKLVVLPTISNKYLDTVFHTFISTVHSLFKRYDVVLICNAANALFSWVPRITGKRVVLNVDGIERNRKKWNKIAKIYYLVSEKLSTFMPNAIVTDANVIKKYYLSKYKKDSVMIPYGAKVERKHGSQELSKFDLKTDNYILYVSRLEPENNAHLVIKAFEKVKADMPLVIVGDAPYATGYIKKLKQTKDKRIKFTGFVFGNQYKALQQNAFAYIQATEVGGTHPALLESLGYGNCVLALDVEEHREVAQDAALYFKDETSLSDKIQSIVDNPETRERHREKGMSIIAASYSWDYITNEYEKLFRFLTRKESIDYADSQITG